MTSIQNNHIFLKQVFYCEISGLGLYFIVILVKKLGDIADWSSYAFVF